MEIPVFYNIPWFGKEGFLTSHAQMYNDKLNTVLRNGLSDNGWTIPNVTAAQLAQIFAFTGVNAMPEGTLWYVSDATPPTLVVQMDDGLGNPTLYKISTTLYP